MSDNSRRSFATPAGPASPQAPDPKGPSPSGRGRGTPLGASGGRPAASAGLLAAWIVLLVIVLLPLPAAAAPAPAPLAGSSDCTGDGIYLYGRENYDGRCRKWTADDRNLGDDSLNDLASSIRFVGSYGGGRYTAILYEHAAYGGAWTAFGADDPNLANDIIGTDRASSIRIVAVPQCTGDGVYLYEHKNYGGRCRKLTADDANLLDTGFNDLASSIKFAGSYSGGRYKVTLCEDANLQGRCSTFSVDDPGFGDENIGHDRTSSIRFRAVKPKMCVPSSGTVTQRFDKHSALDLTSGKAAGNAPVYAAHAGLVVYVGPADTGCKGSYAVAIRYDGTIEGDHVLTLYNHMGHWSNGRFTSYVKVSVGDRVTKGQLIGYQGDAPSGMCAADVSAVQLHFAVYERNKPFLDKYTTWGKRCERSDLFFELGGKTSSCSLRHAAEAANPEAPRFLGPLGATVTQTCK